MLGWQHAVIGLLVLQICVSAAPGNTTNNEDPTKADETKLEVVAVPKEHTREEPIEVNHEEPKLDSQPLLIEESKLEDNSRQSFRQKRFNNYYGYGFPPINPVIYTGYNKRDQSAETGVYGLENPLEHIQRRLQDIASLVRQPIPPPQPTHIPFFFPVIYIPQYECNCNSVNENKTPPPQPENPQTPGPQTPKPGTNQTNPDPEDRFPDLDDDRRNWGLIDNGTESEYDEEEFARPISFDPIAPSQPNMKPAPPVDHGSSQASSSDTAQSTTTVRPSTLPPRQPDSPAQGSASTATQGRPASPPGSSQPYPASFAPNTPRNEQPSSCDGAVLSCCHQAHITYVCFELQGCPNPSPYGNLCDPVVILQAVDKFRRYYGVRNEK